mmetsp:Transcript_34891/g.90405  ORF Transcript_34891/g.90405 Transcript_34891/m.90405 type:complete len:200 (-) Transcript_34891:1351-1950(-)
MLDLLGAMAIARPSSPSLSCIVLLSNLLAAFELTFHDTAAGSLLFVSSPLGGSFVVWTSPCFLSSSSTPTFLSHVCDETLPSGGDGSTFVGLLFPTLIAATPLLSLPFNRTASECLLFKRLSPESAAFNNALLSCCTSIGFSACFLSSSFFVFPPSLTAPHIALTPTSLSRASAPPSFTALLSHFSLLPVGFSSSVFTI